MRINPFRFIPFARRFSKFPANRPLTRVQVRRKALAVEALEHRQLLAIDAFSLHNASMPTDVNHDGHTTALDALNVINALNDHGGAFSVASITKQSLLSSGAAPAVQIFSPLVAAAAFASPGAPAAGASNSPALDVNNDGMVTPLDALNVINQLDQVANPTVIIRLAVTDASGNPITQIHTGENFQLRGFVQNPSTASVGDGVFNAFTNVTFDPALAQVSGAPQFPVYSSNNHPDTSTPGALNQLGGLNPTTTPVGHNEFPLFVVPMTAQSQGTLNFTASADSAQGDDVLVYQSDTPVPADQIDYGTASVTVVAPTVSIGSVTAKENDGTVQVPVTLSSIGSQPVTVKFETFDGPGATGAVAPTNYQAIGSTTLTFNPGDPLTKNITVNLVDDGHVTPDLQFGVVLFQPTNAVLANPDPQNPDPVTGTESAIITEQNVDVPKISIDQTAIAAENAGKVTVNVTLDQAPLAPVTFDAGTIDGTAHDGTDYTAPNPNPSTLTINPGDPLTFPLEVQLIDDGVITGDKTFSIKISNIQGATLQGGDTATVTETEADVPTVSINNVTVTEGTDANAVLTVSLDHAPLPGSPVTVNFTTVDGTGANGAKAGLDYTATSAPPLTFTSTDPLTKTISIPILDDALFESNETFGVQLTGATGANISQTAGTGTVTIVDNNDTTPTISIGGPVKITNSSTPGALTPMVFTVSLTNPSGSPVTVHYATQDGSALAGVDYQETHGDLTFNPGDPLSQTITVNAIGSNVFDATKEFSVVLSSPTNGNLSPSAHVAFGQIVSGAAAPVITVSASQPTITEGDSGTKDAVFLVTVNNPTNQPLTVHYATQDGSAIGGATSTTPGADYVTTSGTLTFNASQVQQQEAVHVPIIGDLINEPNKTFSLVLSNPTAAVLGDSSSATETIVNDDAAPTISVASATATDPFTGTANLTFTVSLSQPSGQADGVFVDYFTTDGTAKSGTHYTATSGTLNIPKGASSGTITVPMIAASVANGQQVQFTLNLDPQSAVNGFVSQGSATGTINGVTPQIIIGDKTVNESDANVTIPVTLSHAVDQPVTVDFTTVDGTGATGAKAGVNYAPTSGTLTFAPNQTTQNITIPLVHDNVVTPNLNFTVQLSNPSSNAALDPQSAGTSHITLNETDVPLISIADASVNENAAQVNLTVTLDQTPLKDLTVNFATADDTAVAGTDYTSKSGTLTFPAGGPKTQTITIAITNRAGIQADRNFKVVLSGASNGQLDQNHGTANVTITDVDVPTISIGDLTVNETDGTANVVVTLSDRPTKPVTVNFATADGNLLDGTGAKAGTDYTAASGPLTLNPSDFPAGQPLTKTIPITILDAKLVTGTKNFTVTLSNPTGGTLDPNHTKATVTINENAPLPIITITGPTTFTQSTDPNAPSTITFTIGLDHTINQEVDFTFTTIDGTAKNNIDFRGGSATRAIAAGTQSGTIDMTVFGDPFAEAEETFQAQISSLVNAKTQDGTGLQRITVKLVNPNPKNSISGFAYVDSNNNGVFDSQEIAMAGVTITLAGRDAEGNALPTLTTVTAADGSYHFNNLDAGTYQITQTTPAGFIAGKNTAGQGGQFVSQGTNTFIVIARAGDALTNYNFGEFGAAPGSISKKNFFGSSF